MVMATAMAMVTAMVTDMAMATIPMMPKQKTKNHRYSRECLVGRNRTFKFLTFISGMETKKEQPMAALFCFG